MSRAGGHEPAIKRAGSRARRRGLRSPAHFLFFVGAFVGICLGLILTWASVPTSTPGKAAALSGVEPELYAALVAQAWSVDGDHDRAVERLAASSPGVSPAQHMADMACRLAVTDYVTNPGGLVTIRSMMDFYQGEGRSNCADRLLPALEMETLLLTDSSPTPVPSATLAPPPSKTPAPTPSLVGTQTATAAPTVTAGPLRQFVLVGLGAYCDAERPALLAVYVQERNGRGIPGMELRVRWDSGEDHFFSGLKPERGLAYADFVMQETQQYRVDMPGRAESSPAFATGGCVDEGESTLRSWRAVFRPAN